MTVHECRDRVRMLGPFLDGELETSKLIELDEHVEQCETCHEEVELLRAMRSSLKRAVSASAPSGLRDRIGKAMAAEVVRGDARTALDADADVLSAGKMGSSWRTMVPLATAAAIALVWSAATHRAQPVTGELRAGFAGDELLNELVAEHSQPLQPEATNRQAVRSLEKYVGFPVDPGSFERAGAHLVGGRVVPLGAQRAAMIQYVVGTGDQQRRVSVLVYDAQKITVGSANLAPRSVGTAEVRVGQERGYSVAATQRAGVGYLLASDLGPEKSAELAAVVYNDR